MNPDWPELFQRYIAGTTTAEEAADLERALKGDAELRTLYLDYMNLDVALEAKAEAAEMTAAVDRVIFPQRKHRTNWLGWRPLAAAAALLVTGVLVWLLLPARHAASPSLRLVSTVNALWDNEGTELSLNAGDAPVGMLHLVGGKAEFATANGASVVLEAPAAFRFDGATTIYVESGKVVCRCPTPESRVTVRTPQTQVVDLGTEFAVEARRDGSTRVAVLSGEVQVGADALSKVLHEGEAAEVRTQGVTMLYTEVVQEMMPRSHEHEPTSASAANRLRNPGFDSTPDDAWKFAEGHAWLEDGALRVSSRGNRFWPSARQSVRQSKLPGRAVTASVRAMQLTGDPLQPMQSAVLKIVFVGGGGRSLAYASRHFQFSGEKPGLFQKATITAAAPPGTKGVSLELLLNARGEKQGTVIFDDAVLTIGDSRSASSAK